MAAAGAGQMSGIRRACLQSDFDRARLGHLWTDGFFAHGDVSVSYTHLDVYKRQLL